MSSPSGGGTTLVSQSDFDKFVKEGLDEGQLLSEAVTDTLDMFEGGTYDLRALFVYENREELELKDKLQSSIHTIVQASGGFDTFVNASFAIGSLFSLLKSLINRPLHVQQGMCRMCESARVAQALLALVGKEDDEEEDEEGDEDDNAPDDEYKANVVLDIIRFMFENCSDYCLRSVTTVELTEECCISMANSIDNNSHIMAVIEKFLYVLSHSFTLPTNLMIFREKTDGFKHLKSALRLSAKRENQTEFTTALQSFIEKYE